MSAVLTGRHLRTVCSSAARKPSEADRLRSMSTTSLEKPRSSSRGRFRDFGERGQHQVMLASGSAQPIKRRHRRAARNHHRRLGGRPPTGKDPDGAVSQRSDEVSENAGTAARPGGAIPAAWRTTWGESHRELPEDGDGQRLHPQAPENPPRRDRSGDETFK